MENKNKKIYILLKLFLVLFFLCLSSALSAQVEVIDEGVERLVEAVTSEQTDTSLVTEEIRDYVIEQTEDGRTVFVQTLSWDATEYASKYDVYIEVQDDDFTWQPLEEVYTSEINSVEVSLYSGRYRYKVVVFNILGIQDAESEWFEFDVFRAIKPEVDSFSPTILYLDEENSDIFSFNGENILTGARDFEQTTISLQIQDKPERTLFGTIVDSSRNSFDVQFNLNEIDVGTYVFVTENPGGLSNNLDFTVNGVVPEDAHKIDVRFLKPYDFNVSLGYAPAWTPPTGDIYELFSTQFLPLGATLRVTYIPYKRNYGQFGVELTAYWTQLYKDYTDYGIDTNSFTATANFVYQLPLIKKRLVLDTHIGAGATYFMNYRFVFSNGVISPVLNVLAATVNGGLSLQVYVARRLYIEVGADYLVSLLNDSLFQAVVPQLSVGWQF